jgi:hypothetical protein
VQDFKAGFEFLVRQMNDKRGIETDLIEARRRIAELESDLDAQKVRVAPVTVAV